MFFNRFRVEPDEGFCVVHFGLLSKAGLLLDSYSCSVPPQTLQRNREALLGYLARVGSPKEKTPLAWQGPPVGQTLQVADIIGVTLSDDMTAEMCLWMFSFTEAARQRRMGSRDTLEAQPLALLRCALELQKQLIAALYAE